MKNIILSRSSPVCLAGGAAFFLLLMEKKVLNLPANMAVWSTCFIIATLSLWGFRNTLKRGEIPWASPQFLYFSWVLMLQFVMGFFLILYRLKTGSAITMRDYLTQASYLVTLGALGAFIGMLIPVRWLARLLPALQWNVDEGRFPIRVIFLLPLLPICGYLWQLHTVPMVFEQLLYLIANTGWLFLVCGFIRWFGPGKLSGLWVIVIAGSWLGYMPETIFYGVRSHFFLFFVLLFWTYSVFKEGKRRRDILVFVFIVVWLMYFVFPWISAYKQYIQRGTGGSVIGSAILANKSKIEAGIGVNDNLLDKTLIFAQTYSFAAQNVATYPQYFPGRYPFLRGESFFKIMSLAIPRLFYPDKPNTQRYVNLLAYKVGIHTAESLKRSSNFIDGISEYYINFGTIGVFLLSIAHGFYLQARYDWLICRSKLALGFPVYAVSLMSSSSFWNIFVSDSRWLAVSITLLWLVSRRYRKFKQI